MKAHTHSTGHISAHSGRDGGPSPSAARKGLSALPSRGKAAIGHALRYRSRARHLAAIISAVLLSVSTALAHGVAHRVFPGGTGIEATYDDGSPMAFCDVEVLPPDSRPTAFQTGTTDPHGRFAFVPDTNGTWTVIVDDGMGHRTSAKVVVTAEGIESADNRPATARPAMALIGVCLIIGLFGTYSLVRQVRER